MAINLKEIGNDPITGAEITKSPHNFNANLLKDNIEAGDTNLTNHENSATAHGSDDIINDSTVVGSKVSDALETIDTRVDNIIASSGTSSTEVVDARTDPNRGTTFTVLKDRLDEDSSDIIAIETKTDFITVTQAVDLDDMETDIEEIQDKLLTDSYSEIQKTFENVQSVPSETLDSPVLMQHKGISIVQDVENGDATTSLTSDDSGTAIDINTDGTWEFLSAYDATNQTFNIVSGEKWFLYCLLKGNSVGEINNLVQLKYATLGSQTVGSAIAVKEVGLIITATQTELANFKLQEATAGLIERECQFAINMTQLGLDTILTTAGYTTDEQQEEAMLNIVRNMDAGDTDIQSAVIDYVSVGKNIENIIENSAIKGSSQTSIVTEEGKLCWKFENCTDLLSVVIIDNFLPNEQYTITFSTKMISGSPRLKFVYTDGSTENINVGTSSFAKLSTTSTLGKSIKSIAYTYSSGANEMYISVEDFQLELGTTATNYIPFKQNTLQEAITTRSLPNGVQDSLES